MPDSSLIRRTCPRSHCCRRTSRAWARTVCLRTGTAPQYRTTLQPGGENIQLNGSYVVVPVILYFFLLYI